MKERRKFEKSYLIVLGIISLFLVVGYSSYALFTVKKENKEAIRIVTGTLTGTLTSEDTSFQDNKITVDANTKKEITITLANNNERDAKLNFYYMDNLGEKVTIGYVYESNDIPPTQAGIILRQEESRSYTIKIRNEKTESITIEFGSDGGLPNKELAFKENRKCIGIYQERDNSGANMPVLADNMIPVVYDTNEKRWEKANVTETWYNYDKQEWANAVTVTNGTRATYQGANSGEEVKMADILQMWVWLPRYSYTIKSEDGEHYYGKKEAGRNDNPSQLLPGEIDVKFIGVTDKDENGSAQYTGGTAINWYTPPGFAFGGKELSGIWIGKFETGYSSGNGTGAGAANVEAAQVDVVETNRMIIKPNVYSWRNIRVSTLDLVSRRMTESDNVFGFNQNIYDSHAIKVSEWALISYLTQSKYGKYGNSLYSGANKEVYINNYNFYTTGCSAGEPSARDSNTCTYQYDNLVNQGGGKGYAGAGASSTGNITGIYDISGGAWEYVMGVYEKHSGNTKDQNSGYTGLLEDGTTFTGLAWPDEKYYDLYTSTDLKTACGGNPCKGHALNETMAWYKDNTVMLNTTNPWFRRGVNRNNSVLAGIFSYNFADGDVHIDYSFRQVLTPR